MIGKRIKMIRNAHNLTQSEFALRLRCLQNTIANYETGRRNPSNQVIELICREFDINEIWLRTGEGEMYVDLPHDDEYFKAATLISKSNDKLAMQAVIEYWKLDEAGKKLLKDFIYKLVENSKGKKE